MEFVDGITLHWRRCGKADEIFNAWEDAWGGYLKP
jgi:hypothetical protein